MVNNAQEVVDGQNSQPIVEPVPVVKPVEMDASSVAVEVAGATVSGGGDSVDAAQSESEASSHAGSELWANGGRTELIQRIEQMMSVGCGPRDIISTLFPANRPPPEGWADSIMWSYLSELVNSPPRRVKLDQYNSFEDAIHLFRSCRRILVLTGAGVSVSCGIPDFRSKDGIYNRLHIDFPDLPDPTAMFDIDYFNKNPKPFFNFATEIFPGQFEPSVSHKFIRELEKSDRLLRNYTQNIDTLERQCGIERVVECHGSFSKCTCLFCKHKFDGDFIKDDVANKRVAICPHCRVGVIKPDIVFFGENLADSFHTQMAQDKDDVDLLVVIGSSLKVRPVALIPFSVPPNVPQILINREPLSNYQPDIELLGDCDEIIRDICIAMSHGFAHILAQHKARLAERAGAAADDASECSSAPLVRRTLVDHTQFVEMMKALDEEESRAADGEEKREKEEGVEANGDKEKGENADADENEKKETEDVDDAPPSKRPCLASMYRRRYVSIASQLPDNAYFQVWPSRAVFPGAELFYDLENHVVCKSVYNPTGRVDDSDCSSSCGESEGEEEEAMSEPARGTMTGDVEVAVRGLSCEPAVDLDTMIAASDAKRIALDEDSGEDEE